MPRHCGCVGCGALHAILQHAVLPCCKNPQMRHSGSQGMRCAGCAGFLPCLLLLLPSHCKALVFGQSRNCTAGCCASSSCLAACAIAASHLPGFAHARVCLLMLSYRPAAAVTRPPCHTACFLAEALF